MPLYVLMVVDGNGESEIIALWLVSAEDECTIGYLMDVFMKWNDAKKTRCVMVDKDMTERNIITEKLPNANLLICLFHTLRSFRREITTEKMGITAAQRVTVLDLFSKLVYAQSEESYQVIYNKLLETKLKSVLNYYDEHWHHICDRACKNRSYLHKIHLFILSYLSLFLCGYTISVSFIEFLRKFCVYDEIFDTVLC